MAMEESKEKSVMAMTSAAAPGAVRADVADSAGRRDVALKGEKSTRDTQSSATAKIDFLLRTEIEHFSPILSSVLSPSSSTSSSSSSSSCSSSFSSSTSSSSSCSSSFSSSSTSSSSSSLPSSQCCSRLPVGSGVSKAADFGNGSDGGGTLDARGKTISAVDIRGDDTCCGSIELNGIGDDHVSDGGGPKSYIVVQNISKRHNIENQINRDFLHLCANTPRFCR
ncbi:hypothetical protein CBR_g29505 [Chara braunii]|uniref:Uncharacterized protein n=1 Tax=Chara braunii TaxID=69332 RepID=A0A388LAK9_CHABU|nr:hypothetical protein CBR_g29505 [Chara braunii]|eukprot:GBG79357.1 hypothetical protein CBR_g29505 [Chara braunii]